MSSRVAILALLVISVAGLLVFRSLPKSSLSDAARTTGAMVSEAIQRSAPADTSLKFEVLRERVLTPYRLPLERRLLLAVTEVRRLAGAPDSAVAAHFAAGRWVLRCGTQDVGTLSELPDFPEMLDLLTEWARKQAWAKNWADNTASEHPELARALDRLDAPAALREADRAWASGSRDAGLFRSAARSYAMLALETPDWGGMPDLIVARSLATLAYARALGAEDPKRETCLLAEVMGYSAAAREHARQLSPRDPLRLYVTRNHAALQQEAAAVGAPPAPKPRVASKTARPTKLAGKSAVAPSAPPPVSLEAAFLHLLQVANRGDYETWSRLLAGFDRPGVPKALVLGTGAHIEHPAAAAPVVEKLFQALDKRPAGKKPASRSPAGTTNLAQQLQRFEAALDARPQPKGGTLFSAEFARAQQRSLVYAALDRLAQRSLESLAPAEMTRWLGSGPSIRRAGKRAAAFQRWYVHLAEARAGRPAIPALRTDVDSAAAGPAQALRSYEALRAHLATGDPTLRAVAQSLVRRMDTRPEHRVELASIAERDLGALSVAERLGVSAATVLGSSDAALLGWQKHFENGTDSLRASRRGGQASPTDSAIGAALSARLVAHPKRWEATEPYARWLAAHKRYGSSRRVVERWVTRTQADSVPDATRIDARVHLARLHQLEGHPEQGLDLLGDLHRGGHFGAMERTALILQDLGRSHQALAIAWAAHQGHPRRAAGRALIAELFWRQARYVDAAKAIHDARPEIASADWRREIAPRFVGCFRARAPEALQAADALIRAGFEDRATLGVIADALADEGLHALAFDMQSRLQLEGPQQVESTVLAYGHLKRAKGEDAALQWVRGRVAEKDLLLLGVFAHQEGHSELLWSMSPARLQREVGDYYWLLRASACMAAGPSHRRHAETLDHLKRAKGAYHLEVARYLLGLREEAEVLSLAQTLRQRSEFAFFAGLKAEHGGRLRDAADWYLISVESGDLENVESRWGAQRLRSWGVERERFDRSAPAQAPPA